MPQVQVSEETFARMQQHAVALVDDANAVISRALDALEATAGSSLPRMSMDGAPDLSFTSVQVATVDRALLSASDSYWNALLLAVIRAAHRRGAASTQITSKRLANYIGGRKEEGGYKYLPEVNLSVQGLDANGAWKATAYLADAFGIPVKVQFAWQNNPKAAKPGATGVLAVGDE